MCNVLEYENRWIQKFWSIRTKIFTRSERESIINERQTIFLSEYYISTIGLIQQAPVITSLLVVFLIVATWLSFELILDYFVSYKCIAPLFLILVLFGLLSS